MSSDAQDLIEIAIERGYLARDVARGVVDEARLRHCSPERILVERRLLSLRRLERLRSHLRYRAMRRADKRYAALAVERGLLAEGAAASGLALQKQHFARAREALRLGGLLIERGLLTIEDDRALRHALAGTCAPAARAPDEGSSNATLGLDEQSRPSGVEVRAASSYRTIEAALSRVEAIKRVQAELSSEQAEGGRQRASPDSAAELENACRTLAKRRAREQPAGRRTGVLAALLGKGAA